MRAFVCGQCHVEYYFKGAAKAVTYPWANGLQVEQIEEYYDKEGFTDWTHAETGTKMLKAQHPEFEVWTQGIHARAGVACADCHMPYQRVGALKVSDHWVRSPLLNINRACQPCHAVPEEELRAVCSPSRTGTTRCCSGRPRPPRIMHGRHRGRHARRARRRARSQAAQALHRKAQWRLDFVAAENSMGFHAPQELARMLGETIDFARQGQLAADRVTRKK